MPCALPLSCGGPPEKAALARWLPSCLAGVALLCLLLLASRRAAISPAMVGIAAGNPPGQGDLPGSPCAPVSASVLGPFARPRFMPTCMVPRCLTRQHTMRSIKCRWSCQLNTWCMPGNMCAQDVHVTVREAAHKVAQVGKKTAPAADMPPRPLDLVLAATHHKTGKWWAL